MLRTIIIDDEPHVRKTLARMVEEECGNIKLLKSADGVKSPVAKLHPYRLFRVYQTASRIPPPELTDLPSRILQTELRLKGESSEPDAALTALVCDLASISRRA